MQALITRIPVVLLVQTVRQPMVTVSVVLTAMFLEIAVKISTVLHVI